MARGRLGESAGIMSTEFGAADEERILLKSCQETIRHKGQRKRVANGERRAVGDDFMLKVAMKGFKGIVQTTGEGEQEISIRKVNTRQSQNVEMVVPSIDVGGH